MVYSYGAVRQFRSLHETADASVTANTVSLFAAGPIGDWDIRQSGEMFHVYLDDAFLRLAASRHDLDPRTIEVREQFRIDDKLLAEIMPALDAALAAGATASM